MLDAQRVAARYLIAADYFKPGDIVLYGKYKNHRGRIVQFCNPTVEIEPVPKGRKQNKVMGLFKMWRADVKEKVLAEQAAAERALAEKALAEQAQGARPVLVADTDEEDEDDLDDDDDE